MLPQLGLFNLYKMENTDRQQSSKWWNSLGEAHKMLYWLKYKKVEFTPSTKHEELTGREIQFIWTNYLSNNNHEIK